MVEHLGHSKGPISVAVRRLANIGLVRKVNGPVNRRNYYAAHPDIFYNNFKFNMATVRKNRSLAENFLARLKAEGVDGSEETVENLEHMRAFYRLMEDFYQDFSERWEAVQVPTLVLFGAGDRLIPNRYLHPKMTPADVADRARAPSACRRSFHMPRYASLKTPVTC